MIDAQRMLIFASVLGALGMWLLLPRGSAGGRSLGIVLVAVALGLGAQQLMSLRDWAANSVFGVLAAVTVISAIATVTLRNPVYCAIWFGMTLLGTAGLLLFTGAQFLAVATVVVYAGAILVTFLFVLMLAQPEGRAGYDRTSWEAVLSAATGAVIVGVLSMTVCSVLFMTMQPGMLAEPPAPQQPAVDVLTPQHVAAVGMELFGRHLIAVEVAGTLLLAALVGAAAIVAERKR